MGRRLGIQFCVYTCIIFPHEFRRDVFDDESIWTYAAGVVEDSSITATCPCNGGTPPPAFVDSDFIVSQELTRGDIILYCNDPLWDGQDCNGPGRTCCDPQNLLWFCKELPQSTTNDLEFHICGDEDLSNEDTPIDLVQLYIQ